MRGRRRALQLAPPALRRAVLLRRETLDFPWLRTRGRDEARRLAAAESAGAQFTVPGRMSFSRGMRYTAVGTAALARLAADAGTTLEHPLLDLRLWGALSAAAPRDGFADRDGALALVAGAVLPPEVIARRTKAGFDAMFFHAPSRAFARAWDGTGVPDALVDPDALRAHWLGAAPDPHSLSLLQALYVRSAGDRVQEPVGRGGQ